MELVIMLEMMDKARKIVSSVIPAILDTGL
jgi:hypothetical protein